MHGIALPMLAQRVKRLLDGVRREILVVVADYVRVDVSLWVHDVELPVLLPRVRRRPGGASVACVHQLSHSKLNRRNTGRSSGFTMVISRERLF